MIRIPGYAPGPEIERRTEIVGEPQHAGWWIAVDLGQAQDFTAFVAGERLTRQVVSQQRTRFGPGWQDVSRRPLNLYHVRQVLRPPIGTSYPAIAEQARIWLAEMPRADLIIDQTGVGRPVGDMMRRMGLRPIGVTITGGADANHVSAYDIRVPKRELATTLQALAQESRLKIAAELPLKAVLETELAAFGTKQSANGHVSFEGREGAHDDIVLATCIGIWVGENRRRPQPPRWTRINYMAR